jgi:hypothetical protein
MTFSQKAARTAKRWRIGAAKTKERIRSRASNMAASDDYDGQMTTQQRNEIYIQ